MSIRFRQVHLGRCGSTNDEVFRRLESLDAVAVWTLDQFQGRGSRGRPWQCPPGYGLAMSLGFKRELTSLPSQFPLSLMTGAIVARTLDPILGSAPIQLKWPNDLFINERKLGGILCESRWRGSSARTVIGIGINLKHHDDLEFLDQPAIAIESIAKPPHAVALFSAIVSTVEMVLSAPINPEKWVHRWLAHATIAIGDSLQFDDDPGIYQLTGIGSSGELVVNGQDGEKRVLDQHETRVRRCAEAPQ